MSTLTFCPLDIRLARWVRRIVLLAEWLTWGVFFAFALSLMALRYLILPSIENYRGDIEAGLSKVFAAKVTIGSIRAGWQGLRPDLDLANVQVYDSAGRPALALPAVSLTLSWWSVPRGELRLHQLDISGADLGVRRLRDGRLEIGGIELGPKPDGRGASDWILSQRRITIHDSRLRWNDEARGAPELALSNINLVLDNSGASHRFGLTADPPRALASRIDLRADLVGESLDRLREWRGETYADLAYIDLAAWRAWLDYPADVQTGGGGVRVWAGFNGDRLEHFAADIALADATVRLRGDLPVLDLARVSGRIAAREIASGGIGFGFLRFGSKHVTGFEVSGKQVALQTRAGVALSPADFTVKTLAANDAQPQRVEIEANSLELEPLAQLIEQLPLDAQLRKAVVEFNPRGAIYDFKLAWRGDFDQPQSYSARGRFVGLAAEARGRIPGFASVSGTVDATEKGGSLNLASKDFALILPLLFEEPRLGFDTLDVQAKWAFPNGKLEVHIDNAAFANADAAGTASGIYRREPDSPGYVDLQAHLTRGEGNKVARYMPVALVHTRAWLKNAIEEGQSDDARMTLRGNLKDYPFVDPKLGLFRVTVKARGTSLHYADGWPRIDNIKGDVLIERNFIEVHAVSGEIGGTRLGKVDVRLPELNSHHHVVEVQGVAEGPTAAFLDFVGASPVRQYIDGFTDTMRATGTAKLNLKLNLPLEDKAKLKVAGQFQMTGTELRLDDGLPQVGRLNGGIDFSEKGVSLRNLRGEALGGPFSLAGGTRADGAIAINAQGNFTAPGLRAWLNDPLLARMSGGAAWHADVVLRKKAPEISIDSSLAGLAIDLPAPFNKAAADALPLKMVKITLPARGEDELAVTLGNIASLRLQRRPEGTAMAVVRGALGVGEAPPQLPPSGVAVNLAAARFDFDDWKRRVFDVPGAGSSGNRVAPSFSITSVNLRADAVSAFGRTLNQVRLTGSQEKGAWVLAVNSREVVGDVNFRPAGQNAQAKLVARLKTLVIPHGDIAQVDTAFDRAADDLPSIDISADNFEVSDKKLGKLQLEASNQGGEWKLQKVSLENPDGALAGSGIWRARARADAKRHLDLNFTLDTQDAGKLLDRLGFPGTVRGAAGRLKGEVAWDGSPLSIDYPTLRGNLEMKVEKGQFLKVDPGVGKLLGIMSLQALPRRLTGDFRDVFSEGFSFDVVSVSSEIDHGVLSTKDFKMGGVAAAVLMSGTVDLVHETQDLKVVVLPDLSGGMGSVISIAMGLNPFVSIGAFLAQKAFKGQISKMFSREYAVQGTWVDPKIARIQNNHASDESSDGTGPGARTPTASGG